MQPVAGPPTGMQRAVGPQTGEQPIGSRPSPQVRGPEAPAQGAGEAATAQQPTRPPGPTTRPAAQQPEGPSPERTQQIRPVHAGGQDGGRHSGGSTRVTEQARPDEEAAAPAAPATPPTQVQPAVSPSDTGSQPAVPGRR
jgi:hypothetical protein